MPVGRRPQLVDELDIVVMRLFPSQNRSVVHRKNTSKIPGRFSRRQRCDPRSKELATSVCTRDEARARGARTKGMSAELVRFGAGRQRERAFYDESFKLAVVQSALRRPPNNRIKPTCACYPGVQPCQVRPSPPRLSALQSVPSAQARRPPPLRPRARAPFRALAQRARAGAQTSHPPPSTCP